jgi:hypothetical protein
MTGLVGCTFDRTSGPSKSARINEANFGGENVQQHSDDW